MNFTNEVIESHFSKTLRQKLSFSSVEYYDRHSFNLPSSEESLFIISGSKSEFGMLITFWIKAIQRIMTYHDIQSIEPDEIECFVASPRIISEKLFNRKLGYINAALKNPVKLTLNLDLIYLMEDEWNEQTFIIEEDKSFTLINWSTTA